MPVMSAMGQPQLIWMVAGVSVVFVLFVYLSIATYLGQRRKERDNYYRFELRKKALEQGASPAALVELQRQEELLAQRRSREGKRVGGLVTAAVGIGLMLAMYYSEDKDAAAMGAVPFFIGMALFVYAQWLAPKGIDAGPGAPGDARRDPPAR